MMCIQKCLKVLPRNSNSHAPGNVEGCYNFATFIVQQVIEIWHPPRNAKGIVPQNFPCLVPRGVQESFTVCEVQYM